MKTTLVALALCIGCIGTSSAQAWKALKNKIQEEATRAIQETTTSTSAGTSIDPQPTGSSSTGLGSSVETGGGRPQQKAGSGGLTAAPKDVLASISSANSAYGSAQYRMARQYIKEALAAVELDLGKKILLSLPTSVEGIAYSEQKDEVASNSSEWAGMAIKREYLDGDRWVSFGLMNNSVAGLASTAMNTGMVNNTYMASGDGGTNQKSIIIKGNQAYVTFSEDDGYELNISIGQQTFCVIEGVNISNETEMVKIAESFDYTAIKKMLGE